MDHVKMYGDGSKTDQNPYFGGMNINFTSDSRNHQGTDASDPYRPYPYPLWDEICAVNHPNLTAKMVSFGHQKRPKVAGTWMG